MKAKIASEYKVSQEAIVIHDFNTGFGGGKSHGTALIYETKDYKLKYEPTFRLRREKLAPAKAANKTRKTKKNLKIKVRKLRGKEKVKALK